MSPDKSTSPKLLRAIRGSPEKPPPMTPPVKRRFLTPRGLLAPINISVSPLLLVLLLPCVIFVSLMTQHKAFPSSTMPIHTTREHRTQTQVQMATGIDQERPAIIAYSLQISAATTRHLPRLFERLYHPLNIHAIHFDAKIPDDEVDTVMKEIEARVPGYQSNTHVVPRQLVTYEGVSIVLNTLSLMSFLLNEVSEPWDFFINLSGSDYPLVEPDTPRKLLGKALRYRPLFFSFASRDRWEAEFRARASTYHMDEALTGEQTGGELRHVRARNPLIERLRFVPAYAEAWMVVPRAFCRFVTESDAGRKMLVTVGNMRGGDEHFFVTLAYNDARWNETIVGNSMRKVVWTFEGKHAGQHPFYLDEREKDGKGFRFLGLLRRSIAFHARKFRTPDSEFMDLVDLLAKDPGRAAMTEKAFNEMMDGLRLRLEQQGHGSTPLRRDKRMRVDAAD